MSPGHGERFQHDLVPEALELADKALGVRLGVVAPEQILGAELGIGPTALEDVVGDH